MGRIISKNMTSKKVELAGRKVGPGEPVYIAAEGGLTNWGDLALAKMQVDAAMAAGCDAVKFQAQTTEDLVSKRENPYWYRRLKYKELSWDDLRTLQTYCSIRNIEYFVTAHVESDLNFLHKELDVPFLKVGSGESINLDFLKKVGACKKPVIMSLGLHLADDEIRKSVATLEDAGTDQIIVLHCSTVYPTPPEVNDLWRIKHLQELLDYPIGYSDHTVGSHMVVAAVALGAVFIEKHLSFDKSDKRSFDCPGSGTPEDWKHIVAHIREVELALRENPEQAEKRIATIEHARLWARQSVTAQRNIPQGMRIEREMLIAKRPGTGLPPETIDAIVGKTTLRDIAEDSFLQKEDFE